MKNKARVKQWLEFSKNDYNVAKEIFSSFSKKPYEIKE